ncbi:nuclear transport factor 2 family protein [Actinophytocola oryzae]|uniref:SnoaL-like protein n=1 Tax=Actinophytocola oryzae TaxID=502181 RepID=A0A4R7W119_9PSEU|nr:nuclear transport factor 2 family protein [Actinophytocola oryzae]TDV56230.1 SnoaL-like protein [Actinophytocola oryzae]
MHPLAALLRRYAYAYTASGDVTRCRELMVDDYELTMGPVTLHGRDTEYLAAVRKQLRQFPALGFTVHDLVLGEDRAALRFTEHGRSTRTGTAAAWSGVSLYRWDGARLTHCGVEQDYASRRRQLETRACQVVASPAVDPWSVEPAAADREAEYAVRAWLEGAGVASLPAGSLDDEHVAPQDRMVPRDGTVTVLDLFSAGSRVAFHIRLDGAATTRYVAGIAEVVGGAVASVRCVTDRLSGWTRR